MDGVFPFFLICIAPVLWTVIVFMAGRWTARHQIIIQSRDPERHGGNGTSPYYQNFEEN